MLIKNTEYILYILYLIFIYKRNTSNDAHACIRMHGVDLHLQHRLILPLPLVSPSLSSPFSFSKRLPLAERLSSSRSEIICLKQTVYMREMRKKDNQCTEEIRKSGDVKKSKERRWSLRRRRVSSWPMTASRMQAHGLQEISVCEGISRDRADKQGW